jgi:hypothetical protein
MTAENKQDRLALFNPTYIEFPRLPLVTNIDGHDVYKYVRPERLNQLVRHMSDCVDLDLFDVVYFNKKGGKWLKDQLQEIQNYTKEILPCEYHPDGRLPLRIAPEHRGLNVGVIDDVRDTRRTTDFIRDDAPNSTLIYVARKLRSDQTEDPKSIHAVDLDDVWLGGAGMNLETEGDGLPKDFLRNEPAIYVKIPKQITPEGKWVY